MSQVKTKAPIIPSGIVSSGQLIRVIIVENHQLVLESLGALLDAQEDMEVVGKASSVAEASAMPRVLAHISSCLTSISRMAAATTPRSPCGIFIRM